MALYPSSSLAHQVIGLENYARGVLSKKTWYNTLLRGNPHLQSRPDPMVCMDVCVWGVFACMCVGVLDVCNCMCVCCVWGCWMLISLLIACQQDTPLHVLLHVGLHRTHEPYRLA